MKTKSKSKSTKSKKGVTALKTIIKLAQAITIHLPSTNSSNKLCINIQYHEFKVYFIFL